MTRPLPLILTSATLALSAGVQALAATPTDTTSSATTSGSTATNPFTASGPGTSPKASGLGYVTTEKYNEMVRYMRNMYEAVNRVNKRVNALEKSGKGSDKGAKPGVEESVDLGESPAPVTTASQRSPHAPRTSAEPTFKVFFDLNLVHKPGVEDLSFDNFHSFLFFEIVPTPDLMFSFDISASPKFYELDYNITPRLQIRAGRIWIPFDDLSPHNIFGGRVNVSKLNPAANPTAQFLPDIWTDLGVGLRYQLMDTPAIQSVAHVYVVNGFQSGGTDPKGTPDLYPNFSTTQYAADNNVDKSFGARAHFLFGRTVGVGASYFHGSWTPSTETDHKGLNMFGLDGQLRLGATELRAGLAGMTVELPDDNMTRGGLYGEVSHKFGNKKQFRFLGRAGTLQLDNRVIDVTDQFIVGGALVYAPGMIELWAEYSQDLNVVAGKENYSYAAARLVVAL